MDRTLIILMLIFMLTTVFFTGTSIHILKKIDLVEARLDEAIERFRGE